MGRDLAVALPSWPLPLDADVLVPGVGAAGALAAPGVAVASCNGHTSPGQQVLGVVLEL